MEIELIKYLRENGINALIDNYHILIKRHLRYPNLVLFKYNQIESPMSELVVRQCRGIILNEANDWEVISCPFYKFFNYNEGNADKIDWESAKIYEKVDGSLMILYFFDNIWNVSSSGTPDASGEVNLSGITFAELFWKVWNNLGYKLPTDITKTYMFELMTPLNRIVVNHTKERIVFHGCRSLTTGQEISPNEVANTEWEVVKVFDFNNLENVIKSLKNIRAIDQEGYVVTDKFFHRIKIKSEQYVALAHIKDNFSTRRIIDLIKTNEGSEFLSYFKEYEEQYYKIIDTVDAFAKLVDEQYNAIKNEITQKDFALKAVKTKFSSILFTLRAKKATDAKDCLFQMDSKNIEELLYKNGYLKTGEIK